MAKFWTNLQPIRKCIFKWNTNLILKHCQRHAGTKGIESLTWISFRTEFAFFLDEEISQVLDSVPWLFYVGNYNSTDRCDWEKFERRLGSAPEDYPLPLGGACPPPWTKLHQLAAISISINQHQSASASIRTNQHQSASLSIKKKIYVYRHKCSKSEEVVAHHHEKSFKTKSGKSWKCHNFSSGTWSWLKGKSWTHRGCHCIVVTTWKITNLISSELIRNIKKDWNKSYLGFVQWTDQCKGLLAQHLPHLQIFSTLKS